MKENINVALLHYSRLTHVTEQLNYERVLRLVAQPLLVPMRLHPLAALMLGDFRLASFLE
jgi:hypothetical protein